MSKILGYVLSLIGILILALTVKPIKETTIVKTILPFIGSISDLYVIIAGFAVLVAAIFFAKKL